MDITKESQRLPCSHLEPEELARLMLQMERANSPGYLPTIPMSELFNTAYQGRSPVVDGLLYSGTYLFAGAPKVGKSFLMAQLAYHVSTGLPLWNYAVRKGTVLYLALEDDYQRLQSRLFRMYGTESVENLHLACQSKLLGAGLEEQLRVFTDQHPDTKLVIIDTLQKVRTVSSGDTYSYASDYEVIGKLKALADQQHICLLLVHHTRKQQADDRFDMISGTNGLMGAADGAFVLYKEKRIDGSAVLEVSGRDQQEQRLHLKRDEERLIWLLERTETELWKEPKDPLLDKVAALVTAEAPQWAGSASDLAAAIQTDLQPNGLSKRLNVKASVLRQDYHIQYHSEHRRNGSYIEMKLLPTES